MSPRIIVFCAVFAPIFGFSLYLLACTASIYPSYQPDIGRIRWFSPFLVLVISFVVASFLAQHSREVVRFLQLALFLCGIVFVIILSGGSSSFASVPNTPEQRTLRSTITLALVHPQFSNRSSAAPFYSAVLAAVLWLVHRARNKPNERN